jgi:hypothetical protein
MWFQFRNVPPAGLYSIERNKWTEVTDLQPRGYIFHMELEACEDSTTQLVETNIEWLRQASSLVARLDDGTYAASPREIVPQRVGSHLRHVLEFYECFLDGLKIGRIDYDRRRRDQSIENSRVAALDRIGSLISRLENAALLDSDSRLGVRIEDCDDELYLDSSVGRELQALSSHTIHHFALIAVTLRLLGVEMDPAFGMSPSTLRYRASKGAERRP